MKEETRDLEAQMEEMATAYQVLMSKNAGLNAFCRKQQEELESLRKALVEAQASQDTEERGNDV
jgi:hypothetical protein